MSWKDDLSSSREFRNKGVKYLYDRAKIYVKMENDPEFIADHKNRAADAKISMGVEEFLEHECADFNGGYTMLKSLITAYPEKKQWEGNRISAMIMEQEKKQIERRREQKHTVPPRRNDADSLFSNKHSAANESASVLLTGSVNKITGKPEAKSIQQSTSAVTDDKHEVVNKTYWNLKEENARLQAENAGLRIENDRLRAELNRLKRKAKKASAAA